MILRRVDPGTGAFLEDVEMDAVPTREDGEPDAAFVVEPCPPGFAWPCWNGTAWVEGGTPAAPVPPAPTVDERVAALEAAMLDLILGGG